MRQAEPMAELMRNRADLLSTARPPVSALGNFPCDAVDGPVAEHGITAIVFPHSVPVGAREAAGALDEGQNDVAAFSAIGMRRETAILHLSLQLARKARIQRDAVRIDVAACPVDAIGFFKTVALDHA